MTTNNDLDDFFKKKDRKGNRHKKQTGLLTNNEELLKQLVIVTSATSAFKENMDFEDEEDTETVGVNNFTRPQTYDETTGNREDGNAVINKSQPYTSSIHNKSKTTSKLSVQDINEQQPGGGGGGGQQEEWEEFEDSNSKYKQLRLKFSRANNGDDDENDDENYDNGNNPINHETNPGDDINNIAGGDDDEQTTRANRRRDQLKDKPVWKLDQVKQTEAIPPGNEPTVSLAEKVEERSIPKTATTSGAYRPPQLRGNAAVTIVSGVSQRPSKKEKPNLASTEDFPTLGAAVNKK